jgi:uncharacterized protein (TIGR00255 family)
MATSMSGCGEATCTREGTTCRAELRTVNNRFFKLTTRSREGLAMLESRIETVLRETIRRGSVHLSIDFSGRNAPGRRQLDGDQLESYLADLRAFSDSRGLGISPEISSLLSLPGVVVEQRADMASLERQWPLIEETLRQAMASLQGMRLAEGSVMAASVRSWCGEIRESVSSIRERVPEMLAAHRQKLRERIERVLEGHPQRVSSADLAREMAIVADRTDIAEELVRLASHLDQMERLLVEESPGRSLDFLAQELAREVNTIASKSSDVTISQTAVDLKSTVEQIREVVQNIE